VAAGSRREARERALELLYEAEARGEPIADVVAAQVLRPDPFAVELVTGVAERQAEIDGLIGRHAKGWTVDRMPVLDRAILRIGVVELTTPGGAPPAVVISEAVELAKRYSTEESGRFVNGVLAAIARESDQAD
jgi:N utilization substance protein B